MITHSYGGISDLMCVCVLVEFSKKDRHNKLQHLVTGFSKSESNEDAHSGVIPIHQDANFYVSEADAGFSQTFQLQPKRQAYLVNIEGSLSVNGTQVAARDGIEVRFIAPLTNSQGVIRFWKFSFKSLSAYERLWNIQCFRIPV